MGISSDQRRGSRFNFLSHLSAGGAATASFGGVEFNYIDTFTVTGKTLS
jgi:hypothetical protein